MTLTETLEHMQARPGMYFFRQDVRELFLVLLGWDMAQDTTWAKRSIERIAKLKGTGCCVPKAEDISFEEAFEVILALVAE